MITYQEIQAANEAIKTTPIEKKDKKTGEIKVNQYAEVNQRIKAFRIVYPNGWIITEMLSNENGVCVFKAACGFWSESGEDKTLGTGTAYEKEGSTFINQQSYIENCETSAVGRALGMAGFGIDTSVCSAEELQNAMLNQKEDEPKEERKASPAQVKILADRYTGEKLEQLLAYNKIEKLEDIPMKKASELISKLTKKKEGQ